MILSQSPIRDGWHATVSPILTQAPLPSTILLMKSETKDPHSTGLGSIA